MVSPLPGAPAGVTHDALSEAGIALQQLGYKPAEILRMLKDAQSTDSAEDLIRHALKTAFRG
jgi:holliday junction DNA helicase RuvA